MILSCMMTCSCSLPVHSDTVLLAGLQVHDDTALTTSVTQHAGDLCRRLHSLSEPAGVPVNQQQAHCSRSSNGSSRFELLACLCVFYLTSTLSSGVLLSPHCRGNGPCTDTAASAQLSNCQPYAARSAGLLAAASVQGPTHG